MSGFSPPGESNVYQRLYLRKSFLYIFKNGRLWVTCIARIFYIDEMPAPQKTAEGERLGSRVALARKSADLTQEELGALLGYKGTSARQMVHQLESGRIPAAWLRLRALSKALDISADWLLGDGETLPRPSGHGPA